MDLAALYRHVPAVERWLRGSYAGARKAAPRSARAYLDVTTEFTLRGGKRFRAVLVLAGYHLATGRSPAPVIPAAAGLEHFQSWMLIHDDIIDHATQRRGGPTVHLTMAGRHRAERLQGNPEEYGSGVGITLGDLEEPFTVEAILAVRAPPGARLAAVEEYARMTRLTAYGQLLDLRNGNLDPAQVTEEDVLEVHRLKSAVYTVAAPLAIGGLLGGASRGRLAALESAALDLGIAFQLRDDLLGAGFDAAGIGKSANDLVEGKRTLLVVVAWREGSLADRRILRSVLGNPHARPKEVEAARSVLQRTGSVDYSEARIRALTDRALRTIARSRTIRPGARPLLGEIAQRLTQRSV